MEKIIDQDKENVSSKYLIISLMSLLTLRKVKMLEAKRKELRNDIYKVYNHSKNE
ncbi:hypothetical protein [Pontibacillus marinus]|uniref:Uncharacterized protein n=1 Tax=Pontibacillus marinus BH030004 = DSM 16465 TaxID=1385511 RepID=A0A0A5GDY3_9BACI|nr:hypothetical protein [Pontibacillus marinus]KGX90204.1 hypothetical protein N783_01545 [Pontibacillus marinus BH030004 = DSM 16465]